jgi:lipase chaperone LimK
MEGTVPDGDIRQTEAGQLQVDAELGHLFDYYLAGLGERDLEAIRQQIERELERRLEPEAAAQAKRLLARYLDYKRALVGLEAGLQSNAGLLEAARARLQAQQQLRLGYFSAGEIAGLFGMSDAYDSDALARIEISQDPALTQQQRSDKLATLDQKLSPAMREERDAPTRVVRTEQSVQQLRAQGAGDDEVYRLRAAAFSPEAANRLAALDLEEAAWKTRIKVYLEQRALLAGQTEAVLGQLRDQHFSGAEQRRLGAYE